MALIPTFIGALVFTIVEALIFFFVVVATPLSQIDFGGSSCYTLWGFKLKCGSTKYASHNKNYSCKRLRDNMNGGAAFAIISIVLTLVTVVLGVLMLVRVAIPVLVTIIFAAVCVLTVLISWACVADVYHSHICSVYGRRLGAGFGLMVTSWVLQVLNLVLIMVMAFV